ncbi:MAG: hypothetical protein J6U40_06795, partial [Kiritimatiellae bacterium]|nr:hypothetical protein [Kiritimatiellia bacterium]
MKKTVWLVVAIFLGLTLGAKEPPARFVSAVRRALDADAEWTMAKTTVSPALTVESSGVVSCFAGRGIVWQMREPFMHEYRMTTNTLAIVSELGTETKGLKDLPYYASIRQQTDRLLAGETAPFSDAFNWTWDEVGTGWTMRLLPKRRQFSRWVKQVTIWGGEAIDRTAIVYASGDQADIRFKETGQKLHKLWETE